MLLARIDECDAKDTFRDELDEQTSPVEDVLKQQKDEFCPFFSCTRPQSGMLFKRVVRKTVRQHNADKSTDESTPATAIEAEYSDPAVPTEGLPKVQVQELADALEGEQEIEGDSSPSAGKEKATAQVASDGSPDEKVLVKRAPLKRALLAKPPPRKMPLRSGRLSRVPPRNVPHLSYSRPMNRTTYS